MFFLPSKSNGQAKADTPASTPSPVRKSAVSAEVAELRPAERDLYEVTEVARRESARDEAYVNLKVRLHQKLLEKINFAALEKLEASQIEMQIGELVRELLQEEQVPLNQKEHGQLVSDIIDEVLGLGPIEPLIKDATVSDILINTYNQVYVERKGRLQLTPVRFKDDRHLLRIIGKIVSSVGRRIDESSPMVDARLKDGSRVNAIIPPLAVDGPLVSIRKFGTMRPSMDNLIAANSITQEIAELLRSIVSARLNILISGGTGSGKTTMLNAMSSFISNAERIVTIEDAAELQLQQPHIVRLETRPANIEGKGEISQRDLVKNALRMRPDRVIIGEVRAGEAFDMLQAMNTGHDGSMTTIHANTCRDATARVEQMVMMCGFDLPIRSIRAQIASAIEVVLQLERMSDGGRRLTSLYEITGMEGDIITMQEIFRYHRLGVDDNGRVHGEFRATGTRPRFVDKFKALGVSISDNMFAPDQKLG
ncbi:MAG: CpaF family protein [Alphaproteobacteria bacterium]|nr:CpaF family protein [Alphaproteobacteria bacterium]